MVQMYAKGGGIEGDEEGVQDKEKIAGFDEKAMIHCVAGAINPCNAK